MSALFTYSGVCDLTRSTRTCIDQFRRRKYTECASRASRKGDSLLYENGTVNFVLAINSKGEHSCCILFLLPSAWIMHRISHPSVQGACCLDIGFRHMFSALDCVAFGWCIRHAVKFSPCVLLTLAQGSGRL